MRIRIFFQIPIFYVLFNLPNVSFCQVPQLINYQAVLTNPVSGQPVTDGDYNIVFSIYNTETSGTAIWTETHDVQTQKGLYHVLLGSISPLAASILNGPEKYLGIKVDSDPEMTPRKRIVSVAYAIVSGDADKLDGMDASEFGDSNSLNAQDGSPEDAVFVDNEGNVGVGNTTPNESLDVSGNIKASGTITSGNTITIDGNTNTISSGNDTTNFTGNLFIDGGRSLKVYAPNGTGKGLIGTFQNPDFAGNYFLDIGTNSSLFNNSAIRFKITNDISDPQMVIRSDGKVGIGLTDPREKLQVKGNIEFDGELKYANTGGKMKFMTASNDHPNGSSYQSAVVIDNNTSNVGIGTTNPMKTLHVDGIIRVSRPGYTGIGHFYPSTDVVVIEAVRTSDDIILKPGNVESVRLKYDGKVGIGISSPAARLHIGGTAGVDGIMFPDGSLQTTANGIGNSLWSVNGNRIYYNNGNVGIGSTSPSEKLDVSGNIKASGIIKSGNSITIDGNSNTIDSDNDTINFTDNFHVVKNNAEIRLTETGGSSLNIRSGTDSSFIYTDTNHPIYFGTHGKLSQVVLDTSGNLGIGTTNPGAKLEIGGVFSNNAGSGYSMIFGSNKWGFRVSTVAENEDFHIDRNLSGTPATALTIDKDNGNVGIGTSNPTDQLHLEKNEPGITFKDLTISNDPRQSRIMNDAGDLILYTGDSGINSNNFSIYDARIRLTNGSEGTIAFGVNNSNRMYIHQSGNVGIGIAEPTAKLHISGTPGVDGIKFPDGTTQTTAAGGGSGSGFIKTGAYLGDSNSTQSITGVGFEPKFVMLWPASNNVANKCAKTDQDSGNFSHDGNNYTEDCILSLDSDGFTVSGNRNFNNATVTYVYVVFK